MTVSTTTKHIVHDYLPSGNGFKVRLLLHQLGIPFDLKLYDIIEKKQTRTADFLDTLNKNGRTPVLEVISNANVTVDGKSDLNTERDEGRLCFAESNAIMLHLAEGSKFLPAAGTLSRARVYQWLSFEQYSHEPKISVPRLRIKLQGFEPVQWKKDNQKVYEEGNAALQIMEDHLARDREFFVGGQYSVVDIALYAYTHTSEEGGYELSVYPNVVAWLARVKAQENHIDIEWTPETTTHA